MDAHAHAHALDAQQDLLESNLPAAFAAYDDARRRNVDRPVVVLLDCDDEIGGQIARQWLGDEAVDDALALHASDDETALFAYAFPYDECRREIPKVFAYLKPVFDAPAPGDGFLAVSVTSGGASALTAPFDARPDPHT